MDGAPIPYDAIIRDSNRGHASHLAQALEQPFSSPRIWRLFGISGTRHVYVVKKRPRHGKLPLIYIRVSFAYYPHHYFYNSFATFAQVTQQVHVAEEWVRNGHNKVDAEIRSHHEVEKALGTLKEDYI